MFEAEESHRLVRRSRPAKEIDKQTALSRVLVGERGEDAPFGQDAVHFQKIPFLGKDFLPGPLSKAAQEVVEPRIVQRTGHGIGFESE